jgi:hypothetical protein
MKSININDISVDDAARADPKDLELLNEILTLQELDPVEYNYIKYVLIATCVFFILSLPVTDTIVSLAFPPANSWLILLLLKTVTFFILFYILYYLTRSADESGDEK